MAEQRHAIVLTGTGANAAYEVGVMQALLLEKWGRKPKKKTHDDETRSDETQDEQTRANDPVDPYCFCGTSIGALNAAIMASRAHLSASAALDCLRRVWLNRIAVPRAGSATGFFRIRAEPTQYLNLSFDPDIQVRPVLEMAADAVYFMRQTAQRFAYALGNAGTVADGAATLTELSQWVDVSPMVELVREVINPTDFMKTTKRVAITALNWQTGVPRTFGNQDLSRPHCHDIVLAAAALPAVFPPRLVEGRPYVDASVLMDKPLSPALVDPNASTVVHVIYVDASVTDIPLPPVSNTFSTAYRLFMLALSRQVNNDVARAEAINKQLRTKQLFESFVTGGRNADATANVVDVIRERLDADAADYWLQLTQYVEMKKLVTIHRFRPRKGVFGFDLAQFERDTIEELIDNGYEDTMNHNCADCGCITGA